MLHAACAAGHPARPRPLFDGAAGAEAGIPAAGAAGRADAGAEDGGEAAGAGAGGGRRAARAREEGDGDARAEATKWRRLAGELHRFVVDHLAGPGPADPPAAGA